MNAKAKAVARPARKRTVERWKMLLYPALIGVPLLAVLIWLLIGVKPEPLTSDEILAKKQWSEKELIETLSRAFAPQSNRDCRKQVLEHLRRQLQQYPEDKQQQIRIKALTGAVGETLRQIRAMPAKEQDNMFDAIEKQAERWRTESRSAEERQMIEGIRNSEEGKAFNAEVSRTIHSELTPDERRKFAPITDIWVQTLKVP